MVFVTENKCKKRDPKQNRKNNRNRNSQLRAGDMPAV